MRLFGMVSTRGSAAFTPHALRSLLRHTSLQPEDQVLLILNDGVAPNEIPHFPQLKLLRNEQPLGFSANMNRVLRAGLACNADVYLLNNDVIFTSGWSEMLEGSVDTIRVPLSNREVRYRASVGTPNSSAAATTFETDTVMTLEQYVDMPSALDFIVESHRRNSSGYLNVLTAPFFCVRIPYAIIDTIGLLDEGFGRGGGRTTTTAYAQYWRATACSTRSAASCCTSAAHLRTPESSRSVWHEKRTSSDTSRRNGERSSRSLHCVKTQRSFNEPAWSRPSPQGSIATPCKPCSGVAR